jgi:hypothetical protein
VFSGMSEENEKGEPKTISERTEGMERFPGYFTYYWDEVKGKIWLEMDSFDTEFLWAPTTWA